MGCNARVGAAGPQIDRTGKRENAGVSQFPIARVYQGLTVQPANCAVGTRKARIISRNYGGKVLDFDHVEA